jgi:hypothetical protein
MIKPVIATFMRRLTLVLIDLYVSKLSIYKGQLLVLRGTPGFLRGVVGFATELTNMAS